MSDVLLELFTLSLSPKEARKAEDGLKNIQNDTNFLNNLILFLYKKEYSIAPRIAAAIYFKNMIKTYWKLEESMFKEKKELIRRNIIDISVQIEDQIKTHIIEAAAIVARHDFPHDWNVLMEILSSLINNGDNKINISGLRIACAVFEKYQQESRSDELFTEINFVMKHFSPSFLLLCKKTYSQIGKEGLTEETLELMCLITEAFYLLSVQDLPEYFEDHIMEFLSIFIGCFQFRKENKEVDLLLKNIVEIARLYALKYTEEFVGIGEFIGVALKTLFSLSTETEEDNLFISSTRFITTVSGISLVSSLFTEELLAEICQKIIIPNIQLRESDLELFEDEPLDFVRSDLEGTFLETRRYVSGELLKTILSFHKQFLFIPLERMLVSFLNEYQKEPLKNWKAKETAFYILICVSFKGEQINRETELVSIPEFFSQYVLQDLQATNEAFHPLIKLNAIRFLVSFKKIILKNQLLQGFELLQHHLQSKNIAVSTYAAIAIENILTIEKEDIFVIAAKEKIEKIQIIIEKLLFLIERKRTIKKICENEFIPKSLFHVLLVTYEDGFNIEKNILPRLCSIVNLIIEEPIFPLFNYFIFKSISVIIRKEKEEERNLILLIQRILQNNIVELTPYAFQIVSYFLEENIQSIQVSEITDKIFPSLLNRTIWQESEIIPFLCRFLCAYITKNHKKIVDNLWINSILGIFKFFIGTKSEEHIGVSIATTFISEMEKSVVEENLKGIILVFLNRIQTGKSKTISFRFCLFLCVFLTRNNFENKISFLSNILENIQIGLFQMVVCSFIIESSSGVLRKIEKKIVMSAISFLICEYPFSFEIKTKALKACLISIQKTISFREEDSTSFNLKQISKEKEYNVTLADEKIVFFSIIKNIEECNKESFYLFIEQELSPSEKNYLNSLNIN